VNSLLERIKSFFGGLINTLKLMFTDNYNPEQLNEIQVTRGYVPAVAGTITGVILTALTWPILKSVVSIIAFVAMLIAYCATVLFIVFVLSYLCTKAAKAVLS
jgi:uncharacterized membrane protein (DUF485 family)